MLVSPSFAATQFLHSQSPKTNFWSHKWRPPRSNCSSNKCFRDRTSSRPSIYNMLSKAAQIGSTRILRSRIYWIPRVAVRSLETPCCTNNSLSSRWMGLILRNYCFKKSYSQRQVLLSFVFKSRSRRRLPSSSIGTPSCTSLWLSKLIIRCLRSIIAKRRLRNRVNRTLAGSNSHSILILIRLTHLSM
jgi:hypothetical protein